MEGGSAVSALEQIRTELVRCLGTAGISVAAAWPEKGAAYYTAPTAAVGFAGGAGETAGFSDYLGQRYDGKKETWVDTYGRRLEVTAAIDAFSSREAGAAGCTELLEKAYEALYGGPLPSGLKLDGAAWDETRWDEILAMYRQRLTLRCRAYFLADVQAETGEILDFKLKGVPVV